MNNKRVYNLKIEKNFKNLIPPLSKEEFEQLEKNIIRDGCREPICVWEDIIIDGHNRYLICSKHNIPFNIQEIYFETVVEAENWICSNQLGRRNIPEETRKYLIGKRYINEKIINKNPVGNNQYTSNYELSPEEKDKKCGLTASKLGKEYKISPRTVIEYSNYAKSIDTLEKNEPELVSKVLSGEIKIGQKKICKISKEKTHSKDKLKRHLEKRKNSNQKTIAEHKVTVKDMPIYDPDAEISALIYTIPSWIGSINRLLKTDFSQTTNLAKTKLLNELDNLIFNIETIKIAIGENNG